MELELIDDPDLKQSIEALREIEYEKNVTILLDALRIAKNRKVEQSNYWQTAQQIFNSIKPRSGYMFDLIIEKGRLVDLGEIVFRKKGKQDRHITPIGVIKHLFEEILQKGQTLGEMRVAILGQIELFKENNSQAANDYIQAVFDYYRHEDAVKNPYQLNQLLKIVAHFYTDVSPLVLSDEYVKIPYHTYNCYLVPTKEFGTDTILHKQEGSFIQALNKILTGFNWILLLGATDKEYNINDALSIKKMKFSQETIAYIEKRANAIKGDNGSLSQQELAQVIYAIYAMFDYLPLPEDAANPKRKPLNKKLHRYVEEDISRLYKVAANHLHFVFAAYPMLAEKYQHEIIEGFLNYVTYGVTENDLKLMGINTLITDTKTDINLTDFTVAGKARGFITQYQVSNKQEDLADEMIKKVVEILEKREPSYREEKLEASKIEWQEEDSDADIEKNIKTPQDKAALILYKYYVHDEDMELNFAKLPIEIQKALAITGETFEAEFEKLWNKNQKEILTENKGFLPVSQLVFSLIKEVYSALADNEETIKQLDESLLDDLLKNAPSGELLIDEEKLLLSESEWKELMELFWYDDAEIAEVKLADNLKQPESMELTSEQQKSKAEAPIETADLSNKTSGKRLPEESPTVSKPKESHKKSKTKEACDDDKKYITKKPDDDDKPPKSRKTQPSSTPAHRYPTRAKDSGKSTIDTKKSSGGSTKTKSRSTEYLLQVTGEDRKLLNNFFDNTLEHMQAFKKCVLTTDSYFQAKDLITIIKVANELPKEKAEEFVNSIMRNNFDSTTKQPLSKLIAKYRDENITHKNKKTAAPKEIKSFGSIFKPTYKR